MALQSTFTYTCDRCGKQEISTSATPKDVRPTKISIHLANVVSSVHFWNTHVCVTCRLKMAQAINDAFNAPRREASVDQEDLI